MFPKLNLCIYHLDTNNRRIDHLNHRDTRSTKCNQLYTPKAYCEPFRKSFMYSVVIWNSLPLHVKNGTSFNTFKSLYLKWKRLNGHGIISNTTANLIQYFVLI